MLSIRDTIYFRRFGAIFAGLDDGYLTTLEEQTAENIRNEVARKISSNFQVSGDEEWANLLTNALVKKLLQGDLHLSTISALLLEEYKHRLDTRRRTCFSPIMSFYEFAYVCSIAYCVLGRVGANFTEIDVIIRDLKMRCLQEMDKYLVEIAGKLSGYFASTLPRTSFRRALMQSTTWMNKRFRNRRNSN
ncbi:unnamed protein product [Oikopleura dioica]|uniref:Uncharacterized protein n=1 Tax=Oikopleura dioica TaxID=34765 RepID=E4YYM5_OIKDI|nr:unnamed protein product [Oikopleura dioica]